MKQHIIKNYFWITKFDESSLHLLVNRARECEFLEEDIERMLGSKTDDLLDDTFEALHVELVEKENQTVVIADRIN